MPEPANSPTQPPAPPDGKKSDSKAVFLGGVFVLILALAGGGYFIMSRRASADSGRNRKAAVSHAAATPPAAVVQLKPFIVNLADTDRAAYLRIAITLGLQKAWAQQGDSAGSSPMTPAIRDTILGVVTAWQSKDLLAPGGKAKLKEQILAALQKRVPDAGVIEVYLTDFLIQE